MTLKTILASILVPAALLLAHGAFAQDAPNNQKGAKKTEKKIEKKIEKKVTVTVNGDSVAVQGAEGDSVFEKRMIIRRNGADCGHAQRGGRTVIIRMDGDKRDTTIILNDGMGMGNAQGEFKFFCDTTFKDAMSLIEKLPNWEEMPQGPQFDDQDEDFQNHPPCEGNQQRRFEFRGDGFPQQPDMDFGWMEQSFGGDLNLKGFDQLVPGEKQTFENDEAKITIKKDKRGGITIKYKKKK